jgi:hypothetical protein
MALICGKMPLTFFFIYEVQKENQRSKPLWVPAFFVSLCLFEHYKWVSHTDFRAEGTLPHSLTRFSFTIKKKGHQFHNH